MFSKECKIGELILETTEVSVGTYFCEQLINSGYKETERVHTNNGTLVIYSNGVLCFVFALIEKTENNLHRFFLCRNHEDSWSKGPVSIPSSLLIPIFRIFCLFTALRAVYNIVYPHQT